MKKISTVVAFSILLGAGCANGADAPHVSSASASAAASQEAELTAPVRVERAIRLLETGKDVALARTQLEAIVAEASVDEGTRDEARLALSRAYELGGDNERAVSIVEKMLAEHPHSAGWRHANAADDRLKALLTPGASSKNEREEEQPFAPFARALMDGALARGGDEVNLEAVILGGSRATRERLGTFNFVDAVREMKREACPLCDPAKLTYNASIVADSSWTAIPRYRAKLASSVVVFYVDLEHQVPSRYDAYLPIPSAEIAERLGRGEGIVAVQKRKAAPPVVLLAAPRSAQLVAVEEHASRLTQVPEKPVAVPLPANLLPSEIQRSVRDARGKFVACYKELLTRQPKAAGKVIFGFTIGKDGVPTGMTVDLEGTLKDAEFERCAHTSASSVRFPAVGPGGTTVKYPLTFSPD